MYWVLAIVLGSIISVFDKQKIHQLFGALQKSKLGVFGVIPASILGIASPLCMYGTVPITASFSEKGMKDDMLAAFMMSSILLNPQLIIYSAALGQTALVIRIVSCFLCGALAGLCVRVFYTNKGKSFFNFLGFGEPTSRDTDPNLFIRLLKNIWRNEKATAPYFLIGIALSAAWGRYIPENLMIPLLQGWLLDGMSMGSATAFMITEPATKITNLGAMKIVLGIKRFVLYILFSMAFAFLSGILVDLIL